MNNHRVMAAFLEYGMTLSLAQADQFVVYYNMLIEWNEKMNLTAITESDEVLSKHFIDSCLSSLVVEFDKHKRLIDIGTGAGFPGIPLKILYPHLEVTLVDALNKRINFLNHVIESLKLKDIRAVHARAEDLARTDERQAYDLCVSRAVSQLNVLCEYCLPFICLDGTFVSYKGPKTMEELEEAKNAIQVLGGSLEKVTNEKLLDNQAVRGFVVIKKEKSTPDQYPRKAGKPTKKPL